MYLQVKSCVALNGEISNMIPCQVGVRQGDNLSPILFSIYLSDLKTYMSKKYKGL